jgi:colanic acid biosynthesis glycosyl transferase WcaI
MPTLNAVADAMLIHLKDEAFLHTTVPSKTQVALYAGRPILMGARGDAASIVQEAGAGIVFEPDNAESLAAAVRELFGMSVETRRSMGEAGAAYYAKHLSLAAGVNVMDGVFRLASERV